VQGPYMNW